MNRLLLIAFFFSFLIVPSNGAVPKSKIEDRELFVYDFVFEVKNAKEYIEELCSDTHFNEAYKKLSDTEKKVINDYYDKANKLLIKVDQHQIDWDSFKREATEILNPCIAVAEKLAQSKLYIFTIKVGSQYGTCNVSCQYKWPHGFGVVACTEIELRGHPPRNKDAYLAFLLGNKEIATVYAGLTTDEKKEVNAFLEQMMALYSRVAEGLLDHITFQDEARAILAPYKTLAEKFARKNLSPFSVEVKMDYHGKLMLIRIAYGYNLSSGDKKFEIVCITKPIE